MTTSFTYLMLDFDGALHRFFPLAGESDESNAHFAFLPAFEAAVRACDRPVRIVIASTWRKKYSLDEIKRMFSPDIGDLIVGGTPYVGSGNGPGGRLAEVNQWLVDHGLQDAPWVGVDDYPELYGPGCAVVACQDKFDHHEHALLVEAVRDPAAFALKHPCRGTFGASPLTVIRGVGTRGSSRGSDY